MRLIRARLRCAMCISGRRSAGGHGPDDAQYESAPATENSRRCTGFGSTSLPGFVGVSVVQVIHLVITSDH